MADKKIRLALIGTNGIPAKYGGAETFYEFLTKELSDRYDITVYCSNKQPKNEIGNSYLGAKLKYYPLSANGWQSVPYDSLSVLHAAIHSDVMLVFGTAGLFAVWMLRALGMRKKVLLNHGGLNEWEREKYSGLEKKWGLWGRRITRKKVIHIADNELYVESLTKTFGIKDVHVIRYGGDNAELVKPNDTLLQKYPFLKEKYYVSVARAQVDNNLHVMLEAFAKMPEKKLVLVSNFKVSDYGKEMYEKYSTGYPNIVLIPGIYDKDELNAVRSNAYVYIHSHARCGTPPSLCEAMNLGLPIVSFEAEVNHEVTGNYAYFFESPEDLIKIINSITGEQYDEMAQKSLQRAKEELTWEHIANQYIALIEGK